MKKIAFHVHTYRCGHAENVPDEAYIQKAIALGAGDIWFTDHAPFPDDPFGARMKYAQLEEYLSTLSALKENYSQINVHIGLEAEYFPSYDKMGYYEYLRSRPEVEMLLLGQHMAQLSETAFTYSFSLEEEQLRRNEYQLLGNAILQGIKSGYFDVVAHPDRIFRRCTAWDAEMNQLSLEIIQQAIAMDVFLEVNQASFENPIHYKQEFWKLVPDNAKLIVGLDAHSLYELECRLQRNS